MERSVREAFDAVTPPEVVQYRRELHLKWTDLVLTAKEAVAHAEYGVHNAVSPVDVRYWELRRDAAQRTLECVKKGYCPTCDEPSYVDAAEADL